MKFRFFISLATLIFLMGGTSFAQSNHNNVPQCFQKSNVDKDSPYVLVLFDFDRSSAGRVVTGLRNSQVVNVDKAEGSVFYIISLSPRNRIGSSPASVDKKVAAVVHAVTKKNSPRNSSYTFGCNEISHPHPKAGGSN